MNSNRPCNCHNNVLYTHLSSDLFGLGWHLELGINRWDQIVWVTIANKINRQFGTLRSPGAHVKLKQYRNIKTEKFSYIKIESQLYLRTEQT